MKKKLFALLLALVLVVTVTVISAMAEETTTSADHANHCVCGGSRNGRGDHTQCTVIEDWQELTVDCFETYTYTTVTDNGDGTTTETSTTILKIKPGSYYLTKNFNLYADVSNSDTFNSVLTAINQPVWIMPGETVNLCLNGFELKHGMNRSFNINGTLNVTDCSAKETGRFCGAGGTGSVAYAYAGGQINVYAGSVISNRGAAYSISGAGVFALSNDQGRAEAEGPSSLTLYGGSLKCRTAGVQGNGGVLSIWETSTFTMYGGNIQGGNVTGHGGAIYSTSTGDIKLLGGKIVSGQSEKGSDGVYATGVVTLGGAVTVEELYLKSGGTVVTEDLTGSVGLATDANNFAVLTTCTEAEAACFTSSMPANHTLTSTAGETGYAIAFAATAHTNHCVCGGNLDSEAAIAAHGECVITENWIALTNDNISDYLVASDTTDGGDENYYMFADDYDNASFYLAENITMKAPIEIHNDDNINLCLNGYTFTYSKATWQLSAFRVWGSLNLSDCIGSGVATTDNTGGGGLIYLFNQKATANVNIYGGTYMATDKDLTNSGGVIRVGVSTEDATLSDAVLNLYGGTVTGGTGSMGGNIYLDRIGGYDCVVAFNMYGGKVTNGQAKTRGGNIYVNHGVANIYGGEITGGSLTTPGYGADLAMGAPNAQDASIVLDGKVTIGQIGVWGSALAYSVSLGENFETSTPIEVSYSAASSYGYVVFAQYAKSYEIKNDFYTTDSENFYVTAEKSGDYYALRLRPVTQVYHCRCGGAPTHESLGHSCYDVAWTELTAELLATFTTTTNDGSSYVIPAGSYILNADLTVDKCLRIEKDTTVNLDLNGHTLTDNGSAGTKILRVAGWLNVCDSSYNAQGETEEARFQGQIIATKEASGSLVYVSKDTGKMILYGGNLKTAYTESSVPTYAAVATSGELYISGGTVTGANLTSSNSGGTISVFDNAVMRVYGGVISGGTAVRGGNICAPAAASYVRIVGGEITGGTALGAASGTNGGGGNIYSTGTVTISGGTITGGTASRTQSSAQAYGGNIYHNGGTKTMTISGGTISGGTAVTGGNIFVRGTFEMTDGTISNGTATTATAGNIRVVSTGSVNMTGGTVSDGHACKQGGNAYFENITAENNVIENVKFSGGISDESVGGSVCISGCASMTLKNVEIDGGSTPKSSGGALYMAVEDDYAGETPEYSISDCVIKNGSAGYYGGNIELKNVNATLTNCTITDGNAKLGGNVYSTAKLSVVGGTISGGEATAEGGNLYVTNMEMTSGTVSGGVSASYGGSIYIKGDTTITDSVIEKGVCAHATCSGGNICVESGTLTIEGNTVISGGKAYEGGNLSSRGNGTIVIDGGTITGGEAGNHGGNIVMFGSLTINDGTISDGVAVNRGGNISGFANKCNITINGGTITGGKVTSSDEDGDGVVDLAPDSLYGYNVAMYTDSENIDIYLTINGGTISGAGEGNLALTGVHVLSADPGIVTTVSGAPVIDDLRLGTDRMLTVGELTEGASIGISRFEIVGLFAPEASADYASYFHGTHEGISVSSDDTGLILVSENPYWAFTSNNKAIAPAATIAEAMQIEGIGFVKLIQDYASSETYEGNVYLNLNGYDLSGLTVNGNLYVVDYATHNYEEDVWGSFSGTVSGTINDGKVVYNVADVEQFGSGTNYVKLANEDGSWSFHRVRVSITHMSLKAADDALGFKATIEGDSLVQAAVTGIGFNMGAGDNNMVSFSKTGTPTDGVFTLRLKNIMANNGGELSIVGQPVIFFGEESVTGGNKTTSMKKTIEAVETALAENAEAYTQTQIESVQALIAQYESKMEGWDIDTIKAWTAPSTEEETTAA